AQIRGRRLLQIFLEPLEPALDDAQVGEDEFVFHRLDIAEWIDRTGGVGDVLVAERTDDVQQRIRIAERGDVEEILGPARADAGNVGTLHGRRGLLLRVVHRGQTVQSLVRYPRDSNVGFNFSVLSRAGRLAGARHQTEERGFS